MQLKVLRLIASLPSFSVTLHQALSALALAPALYSPLGARAHAADDGGFQPRVAAAAAADAHRAATPAAGSLQGAR